MDRYKMYCTEEQTRKAFELGAPIKYEHYKSNGYDCKFSATPTAEQMRGWLMEKLNATTFANKHYSCGVKEGYGYLIIGSECVLELDASDDGKYLLNTDKEATLAAIDAALEYLENLKR